MRFQRQTGRHMYRLPIKPLETRWRIGFNSYYELDLNLMFKVNMTFNSG